MGKCSVLIEPYVQLVGSSYSDYVYTLVLTAILFWIYCRLGGTSIESPALGNFTG